MGSKRQISDDVVEKIVNIIKTWKTDKKFGWEPLREAIRASYKWPSVDQVWSRVQLPKYKPIRDAYDDLKEKIRCDSSLKSEEDDSSPELKMAYAQIDMLQSSVDRLEKQNNELLEKFERWAYNAKTKNVSEAQLDAPLIFGASRK